MDQVSRYHPLLVALHWVMALLIIAALALGALVLVRIPNSNPMKIEALRGHMGSGLLILTLMLLRLFTRILTRHPPAARAGNALLDRIAWASHRIFYTVVLGLAGTGVVMVLRAGLFATVFGGHGSLPADFWVFSARRVHYALSRFLITLIVLHVAAAFYHALVLKDGLLRRMFFGSRSVVANAAATSFTRPLSGA